MTKLFATSFAIYCVVFWAIGAFSQWDMNWIAGLPEWQPYQRGFMAFNVVASLFLWSAVTLWLFLMTGWGSRSK